MDVPPRSTSCRGSSSSHFLTVGDPQVWGLRSRRPPVGPTNGVTPEVVGPVVSEVPGQAVNEVVRGRLRDHVHRRDPLATVGPMVVRVLEETPLSASWTRTPRRGWTTDPDTPRSFLSGCRGVIRVDSGSRVPGSCPGPFPWDVSRSQSSLRAGRRLPTTRHSQPRPTRPSVTR